MQLQQLYSSASLSAGADLWVIPDMGHSNWSHKLNWYLNNQISRVLCHEKKSTSEPIEKILEENKFDFQFNFNVSEDAPLLISPNLKMPCHQILLHFFKSPEDWVKKIYHSIIDLHPKSVRIFLPYDFTENDFRNLWPQQEENFDLKISLVLSNRTSH